MTQPDPTPPERLPHDSGLDDALPDAESLESGSELEPPEDIPAVSAELLVDNEESQESPAEPVGRRYPSTIGGAFYLLVLALTLTGLGITAAGSWRLGTRIIGGSLLFAAAVRLVLRPQDAGMLAVRPKIVDALVLIVVGIAILVLATTIPDQPV